MGTNFWSAKVRAKLSLKDMPQHIQKQFAVEIKRELADIIVEQLTRGKSAVDPETAKTNVKWDGYKSKRYRDKYKGGRKKPVDMVLTGKMLNSLKIKQNAVGQVVIFFGNDTAAKYHDKKGTGRNKIIRRLLPTRRGEQFAPKIMKKVMRILQKAVKSGVAKQRR